MMQRGGRWLVMLLLAPSAQALSVADVQREAAAASVEVLVGGRLEGSGWFADKEGLIITAGHAVAGVRDKVEARLASGDRLEAKLMALDLGHDLALISVPRRDKAYPALRIAETIPDTGTGILFFGAVMMRHGFLLSGTVARSTTSYEYRPSQKCYAEVYYVTGASPPGTSGGCWLDARGQVVGMQSGYISMDGKSTGIAQVVPPDPIRRLVRARKSAQTPDIGAAIEELWEKSKEVIAKYPPGSEGVLTVTLHKGGPATAAGLTEQSLVTGADGHPIRLRDELLNHVRSKRACETITLRVWQPGDKTPREVPVKLGCTEGGVVK